MNPCRLSIVLLALSGLHTIAARSADDDGVAEYRAEYDVEHNGNRVATAAFSVTAAEAGRYDFASSTKARLILRLAAPKPVTENSRFEIDAGRLVPLSFAYEDGSRKGEDNYSVAFDPAAGEIRINSSAGPRILPFEADVLDRGSLQVALMRDLASCRHPGPYRYTDDEAVKTYEYERLDDRNATTAIGDVRTVRFAQQRDGSSRRTILWLAPDYHYVPVRIEQMDDGEIETVFIIDKLSGMSSAASECSSFR
jgi:hypothetical protein